MTVRLYVEGGGDSKKLRVQCRRGPHGPVNGIVVPGGQTGLEDVLRAQSSTRSRFLRTRESSKSPRLMSWTVWRGQRGRRARGRTTRDRRASTSSRRSIRPRLRDQHGTPSVSWTPSVPGTRGEALSGDGRQGKTASRRPMPGRSRSLPAQSVRRGDRRRAETLPEAVSALLPGAKHYRVTEGKAGVVVRCLDDLAPFLRNPYDAVTAAGRRRYLRQFRRFYLDFGVGASPAAVPPRLVPLRHPAVRSQPRRPPVLRDRGRGVAAGVRET